MDDSPSAAETPGGSSDWIPIVDSLAQRMAEAALANARGLSEAAAALSKDKRYGVARSLALLGLEEGVKAWVYRNVAIGYATFDKRLKGTVRSVQGEKVKLHFMLGEGVLNSKHPEEHTLDAGLDLTLYMMELVFGLIPRIARGEVSQDDDPEVLFPGFGPRLEGTMETALSLNDQKNAGLYVRHEGDRVQTPDDVTREEYTVVADRIKRRVEFLQVMVSPFAPSESEGALLSALFGSSAKGIIELRSLMPRAPGERGARTGDSPTEE
jgi:AbiV family abortive infection protein